MIIYRFEYTCCNDRFGIHSCVFYAGEVAEGVSAFASDEERVGNTAFVTRIDEKGSVRYEVKLVGYKYLLRKLSK